MTAWESAPVHTASVARALHHRRAVKKFDPNFRIPQEEFTRLMEHVLLSPTAFNLQHWRFVRVTDPALRARIRESAFDQPQVTEASELLVLCFDRNAWKKDPARHWRQAPQEVSDFVVKAVTDYYEGNEQAQRDEGMRSCGIAAQSLMLMAREMGYDTCPMDLGDLGLLGSLLNLPPDHVVCMVIALGKGVREPWPRGGKLSMAEVVIENRF
jgi:nitroreductase